MGLPPFPNVAKERTEHGWCFRLAFSVGEWQDKLYRQAKEGAWYLARESANRIIKDEEQLQKFCGVDIRRAQYYMHDILKAIDKMDWHMIDRLISIHDSEILAALETAKK